MSVPKVQRYYKNAQDDILLISLKFILFTKIIKERTKKIDKFKSYHKNIYIIQQLRYQENEGNVRKPGDRYINLPFDAVQPCPTGKIFALQR